MTTEIFHFKTLNRGDKIELAFVVHGGMIL
jgi:hypothetical protein